MNKSHQNNSNETRRERFKRLATHRTNEVLKRLRILGNCANKQLYEYDEKDIKKIFSEIRSKVNEVESQFKLKSENKDKEFKL